jgi:hypothetical protein
MTVSGERLGLAPALFWDAEGLTLTETGDSNGEVQELQMTPAPKSIVVQMPSARYIRSKTYIGQFSLMPTDWSNIFIHFILSCEFL